MAWIRLIEEDEAEGRLKESYAKRMDKEGKVAESIFIAGLFVPTLTPFYRIDVEFLAGAVDHLFQNKVGLGVAVAAEGAAGRLVRIVAVPFVADGVVLVHPGQP